MATEQTKPYECSCLVCDFHCPHCGARLDAKGPCGHPYAKLEKTIAHLREEIGELHKANATRAALQHEYHMGVSPEDDRRRAQEEEELSPPPPGPSRRGRTTHPGAAPGGGVE